MPFVSAASLAALANAAQDTATNPPALSRPLSIWEITSWILPMAPEHFRRVLAATPHLPQGVAGAEGGTRWFTLADLAPLRAHFASGPRKARYTPTRAVRAPLIALTGPLGAMGRTSCLLHLAVGAALSGYRVLVIEGDPAAAFSRPLPCPSAEGAGVLSLIARSAAGHLRRLNEARLDRGEAPQPMDEVLSTALPLRAADLIRPSLWPGLDVMAASPALMQADARIAGWSQSLRGWSPGGALAAAVDDEGLRQHYDVILCDTPRGLGPLALSLLMAADVLLAPVPLQSVGVQVGGLARLASGLHSLAEAVTRQEAAAQMTARALGQSAAPQVWQQLLVLPNRAGPDAARQMAGFAAKLGDTLLPAALPEIEAVAAGRVVQAYDLDYRDLGRLAYAPLREGCDAAWRAVAAAAARQGSQPTPSPASGASA